MRRWLAACGVVLAFAAEPGAQQKPEAVTADRLVAGHKDQSQWLMFGGDYTAQRHSPLTQVTPQNVTRLAHQWTFQTGTLGALETTTLVHDGVLYVTGPNNVAWALDAKTGKSFWRYRRTLPADLRACCGPVNRGFAILGNRLFMTTLDAHLIALDARTGELVWDIALEDYKKGYASTIAPLVVKNKVVVGVAGGEYGAPGFIAAFDVGERQAGVEIQHGAAARRVRQRHLGGRFGGARRRRRLGHRELRSGAEPSLLRHRQPLTRLPWGQPAGRQPVHEHAAWRSTATPASGAGTTSSRRTTRTTGTRPTCRSWAS